MITLILVLHAGDRKWAPQKEALSRGTDVVIGTPGRVLSHVQAGTLDLSACQTVVIDEVDVLLGDQHAFAEQVEAHSNPGCLITQLCMYDGVHTNSP